MTKILLIIFTFSCTFCQAQLQYKGYFKEYENNMQGISLVQSIVFSPDGKNAYTASYNGFDWFTCNTTGAGLTYKGCLKDGGNGGDGVSDGHAIVVSPDGKYIYLAAGYQENSITTYKRNPTTGEPEFVELIRDGDQNISTMKYPYGMDIDSKGKHIYVVNKDWDGNSVIWLERNADNGKLTYKGKLVDGVNGIDGLGFASDIDISGDDKFVYITAFGDDVVSWYERDENTGALTQKGMIKNGQNGIDCLDNPYWVEVSPDGKFVYVSAQDASAISWYERNNQTGALTYKGNIKNGVHLSGVRGFSIHPNGNWLVASASYGGEITWFNINKTSGELTYINYLKDGENNVNGIAGSRYNCFSPDGAMFIATGYGGDELGWFAWSSPDGVYFSKEINYQLYSNGNEVIYNSFDTKNSEVNYTISDLSGRILFQSKFKLNEENTSFPFRQLISNSGIYIVSISGKYETRSIKVAAY